MKKLFLFILFLAAAYVISYACIVTPSSIPEVKGLPPWLRAPEYSVKNDIVVQIYGPAIELDRKLFPKRWQF